MTALQVWGRLAHFRGMKKRHKRYGVERPPVLGVLGCMAERLKTKLLEQEKAVDLIAGPDAYRDLPNLIAMVQVCVCTIHAFRKTPI